MAASGKKSKKKWISVPAETVLEPRKTTDWADEVARELDGNGHGLPYLPKVELPTAPKASRGSVIDESKIPTVGPFQVHISNIPYDLNEDELMEVFANLRVKSVKLAKEEKTAKPKGYGYIEFEDRSSLSAALSLGDTMLKGRSIKIDLPNNSDRQGNRMRSNRDRDQGSSDRTTGNWRSGPRQDDFEDRGYNRDRGYGDDRRREGGGGGFGGGGGGSGFSRGGFDREERGFSRGGFDREDRGERGGFDRGGGSGRDDRGGFRERFGGGGGGGRDGSGFSYNDRGFRDRGREESRFSRNEDRGGGGSGGGSWRDDQPRGGGGGFGGGGGGGGGRFEDRGRDGERGRFGGDRDRDRGGGFGGDRDRDRGGGFGGDRDREGGRYGPPRRDDPPLVDRGEARNRPKLQLQPRSKPKEEASDNASTSASIFGGAKPVDTAAREREIEERLMRSDEFADSGRVRSGPGSTGSGSREDRRERQWEPSEKRMEPAEKHVEPAPPPKENPWTRKAAQPSVNNGRSSPEDEGSRIDENSVDRHQDDSKSKRDENRGQRPSRRAASREAADEPRDKSRGKESERQSSKHREGKASVDDVSKMPKLQDTKTPNFADSNKYSSLVDSDEAPTE